MQDDDQLLLFDLADDETPKPEPVEPVSAATVLPHLTLRAALTATQSRALRAGSPRLAAMVVKVPSVDWVRPMEKAARALGPWDRIVAPIDIRPARKEEAAHHTVDALATGGRVLGISNDPSRFLPASLVSGADLTIDVGTPSNRVVAGVIRAVTNRRARSLPPALCMGLNYGDIVSAIRPSTAPIACIRRLLAAKASKTVVDTSLDTVPTLDRLHGYGEAMEWCNALVADLRDWREGRAPFPPNCRAVLAGPPGTGKTMLVRSLAVTANLPLVATSVGGFFLNSSGHLDGVIKQISEVWDVARALGTAVVLLDELDGLPNRATMDPRGRDWWVPVVNHMLTCLDGATSGVTRNLVIVGTTNHASHLDAALTRPGRLERIIRVGLPESPAEREGILRGYLDGQLDGEDLAVAAQASEGMTGADLMAVVRDARKRARSAGRVLSITDLLAELLPPSRLPPADRRRCAVHEAGHAVAAHALAFPISTVAISHRDGDGGQVSYEAARMPRLPTRDDLERWVVLLLAGGAAEETLLGVRSTGQGGRDDSDIGQATSVVASMHVSYGLSGALSYRADARNAARLLGDDPRLRRAVEADLARLQAKALALVRERRASIEWLAEALEQSGFMTGTDAFAGLSRLGGTPGGSQENPTQATDPGQGSVGNPDDEPSTSACTRAVPFVPPRRRPLPTTQLGAVQARAAHAPARSTPANRQARPRARQGMLGSRAVQRSPRNARQGRRGHG